MTHVRSVRRVRVAALAAALVACAGPGDGAVVVTSPSDETSYRVLARADFDRDGAEDLLVRTNWHAVGGSGTGRDLLLLSKPSASAPVRVGWRAPLDSLSTAPAALLR